MSKPERTPPQDTSQEDLFFQCLAGATQDGIVVLDPQGTVLFANLRVQQVLREDVRGRDWATLWGEEHQAEIRRALSAAREGETARIRTFRPRNDVAPQWWDTVVTPVLRDGVMTHILATSRDVTAQIEAQSILDTIIEYVPAALFAKDAREGRFVMLNRAAEEFFGMSKDDMLGRTYAELVPPERAEAMDALCADVARTGRVHVSEHPVQLTSGDERIYKTRIMATFGDEGARHLLGVSEDVTDERAAAEALRAAADRAEAANRSKSEFLANMSHEIRTPLNGVVAVADVLSRTDLDERQREMVELVRSSGATLERLLSDVLDLARIESGATEIQNAPFHLADAVRGVAGLLAMRAQEKGIAVNVVLPPEAEGAVLGDMVRVKQILTNLASNAVKFTERGEVRIEVVAHGAPGEKPFFRFAVHDTGVGFDPGSKERVFGRFQQADGSITRRFGGSGLGLSISRQLAELMGGQLDCDSEPGRGSIFWVDLPLTPVAGGVPASSTARDQAAETFADTRPIRILLADDHPTNRKVVELILTPLGAELVTVEDGRQAVDAYTAGAFDVVLMDMQMPVLDGLSATREIRALERAAGTPPTPIFMLTANALPEHLEASCAAGADRHMTKPITADKLIRALVELEGGGAKRAA